MSDFLSIEPVRPTGKLCEIVRDQLEKMIIGGKIRIHEQLPTEASLAKSFGVSRTVVREAIQRLEGQGLVRARVGSGSFVVPFQLNEIKSAMLRYGSLNPGPETFLQMHELRAIIECENAARVANIHEPETVVMLRKLLADMEKCIKAGPTKSAELMKADMDFHMTIAHATGNPFLSTIIEPLKHHLSSFASGIYRGAERLKETLEEHRAIVEAIATNDGAGARSAMQRHLEHGRRRFMDYLERRGQNPDAMPQARRSDGA